jgi:antirestriction protein ArdC
MGTDSTRCPSGSKASRFHGKAKDAADRIVAAFQSGTLPKALAPIFINRPDEDTPCRKWSWSNQLLTALAGHSDARGFRQWQSVGRHVKKGQKSFQILAPMTKKVERKDKATGEVSEGVAVFGFRAVAVFGLEQTEGDSLPEPDPAIAEWLKNLPLADVAEHWGLSVESFQGGEGRPQGWYRRGQAIALGVENLSTWCHELCHAADYKTGGLTELGQHWRSETVAELGASILLECLGYSDDSDRGGCWEYVRAYATKAEIEPIKACQRVLGRTCDAVALILDTAAELQAAKLQPAE